MIRNLSTHRYEHCRAEGVDVVTRTAGGEERQLPRGWQPGKHNPTTLTLSKLVNQGKEELALLSPVHVGACLRLCILIALAQGCPAALPIVLALFGCLCSTFCASC